MTILHNNTAGQLDKQLDASDWAKLTSLEVSGVLNYNDWIFLSTLKKYNSLSVLDLSKTVGLTQTGELDYPFAKFKSLERLILPEGITCIDACSFDSCDNLFYVSIPNTVTHIGEMAFRNCRSLANIAIPEGVNSIDTFAFWNCTSLSQVTLPSNLQTIKNGAFVNCSSLREIRLPNGIKTIAESTFRNCVQLTSVDLPKELEEIKAKAFEHCMRLTELLLPNTVITICDEAFKGCIKLRQINLPSKIAEIGKKAFEDCSSLVSISIPFNIKTLSNEIFRGCSHLEKLDIAACRSEMHQSGKWKYVGLQKIGEEALRHCRSLSVISLPASMKIIEAHAFRGCKIVNTFECLASNPPMVMPNSFAGLDVENITLVVPTHHAEKYRVAEVWCNFKNIRGKDDSDMFV